MISTLLGPNHTPQGGVLIGLFPEVLGTQPRHKVMSGVSVRKASERIVGAAILVQNSGQDCEVSGFCVDADLLWGMLLRANNAVPSRAALL